MLLRDIADASTRVASTSKRTAKLAAIADCLRQAKADDVPVVVAYLSGELRQRRTGVGWASLRDLPAPGDVPTLTAGEADAALTRIASLSGPGSQRARGEQVRALFARATEPEQRLLRGLLTGELRQGALEGVMLDAIAVAGGLPGAEVRRAAMLAGDLAEVARTVLADGQAGLARFRLQVGRPLLPMLASPGADVATAAQRLGEAAWDWKLDGVRVQLHRDGGDVAVFSRSLDDITSRVPEIVEVARALPLRTAVLDGEAIALRPDGRPRPFQRTGSRIGSRVDVDKARRDTPLSTFVFDLLHLDGRDVLAEPAAHRFTMLAGALPGELVVPRLVTGDPEAARAFLADALAHGHEGVVAKSLAAAYDAGRRGTGWLKIKPTHTLDLVVLAAEWGHGRRQGWLSNLHLGARDPETGEFVMLGKTFKGLTDEMLRWQTERLQQLATRSDDWVVQVRPELVVEVAFDGVQTSPRYPAGLALRFARVLRHRPDKKAQEADTVHVVKAIHGSRLGQE